MDLRGKRVLVRVDFNVPYDEHMAIVDDHRIRRELHTINFLLDQGAKIILCSHYGRPEGRDSKASLKPVARRLSRLLDLPVTMAPDCVGPEVEALIEKMNPGDIVLLENLRYHQGESKNDPEFARELAKLGDVYINDAFAVSHRAHASVDAITQFVAEAGAGYTMKDELSFFARTLVEPRRPVAVVIGGSKAVTKLEALDNLLDHVEKMLVGGAMANNFLKAQGWEVGRSLIVEDLVEVARCLIGRSREMDVKLYLPVDCVIAAAVEPNAEAKIVPVQEVPPDWHILDIGPATGQLYRSALDNCKTIIWNGPLGLFEMDAFSRGTMAMVDVVANSYALTIIGGGDTDVAVARAGVADKISYISTGGGAFLQILTGGELPGVTALGGHTGLEKLLGKDSCFAAASGPSRS
ncbi:MAG: phosphoglycerate kinase [Proteobacteria bacterium]|nr:phosphoglycerate kinase [Pseudomonadota bacterium]